MPDFKIKDEDEKKLREEAVYPHWRLHFSPQEGVRAVELHNPGWYRHHWAGGFMTLQAFTVKEAAEAMLPEAELLPYNIDISGLPQPLLDRHVPLIHHENPSWFYITAVCVSSPGSILDHYEMPTDEELAMIASYHDEYMHHYYGDPNYGWAARMRKRHPFDIDGGANGRYLMKYAIADEARERGYKSGWARKHMTWKHGPRPARFNSDEQMTLLEILDLDHTIGGDPMQHWIDWKNDHPEIFGAKSDG